MTICISLGEITKEISYFHTEKSRKIVGSVNFIIALIESRQNFGLKCISSENLFYTFIITGLSARRLSSP